MSIIQPPGPVNIGGQKFTKEELSRRIARQQGRGSQDTLARFKRMDAADRIKQATAILKAGRVANLTPVLPLLLNLKGEPYHLGDHFPFEPLFNTHMPRSSVWVAGRQVSKSTSLAAQGVIITSTIPYFNTLFVTPLYEMIRRFSTNYVQGFVHESPIRSMLVDTTTSQNVLQRSFRNRSTMFFSFAFLSADRVRGIATSKTVYDEVQDLDSSFIAVIRETMSGSRRFGIEQFAGTPKTLDGTLEGLWLQSSMAQWHIRCQACNHENIPALSHDLDKMIGPDFVDREISEAQPGIVCAKCSRPVYPRSGQWVHHDRELRQTRAGYHIPQIIMPMHYADTEKWGVLLGKRMGFGNTPPHVFYNEVCGESYDTGAKLITKTELMRACTKRPNDLAYAKAHTGDYIHRICAADWGGGGEEEISYTAVAVLGMKPDGKIDVLYGWRSRTPHDHNAEVREILRIMVAWRCTHLAHDYTGAGAIRETLMVNAGFPMHRIIPVAYIRAGTGAIMRQIPENDNTGQRMHYRVDKARSLVQTCALIKYGGIHFFKYDYTGEGRAGLIHDFLSLTEDMVDSRTGSNIYTVIRSAKMGPDDFAQAVNIGSCALFYRARSWPNLAELAAISVDPRVLEIAHPLHEVEWEDFD